MIDRFEVIDALGTGAFATVWLARDPVLDLQFAIKVLADNWSRDRLIKRRFIAEARVLAQSSSPRIVRVHNVGELDDGRPFFVMTWADRGTLEQRIQDNTDTDTVFSVTEASAILSEVARAVGDVHDGDRIHRDIKPGNILITSTTSRSAVPIAGLAPDERLLLGDFGLARDLDASALTFVSGSPAYVAPEQARGLDQLTEVVDLYPLGIMAAELTTGTRPAFRASMAEAAAGEIDISEHFTRHDVTSDPAFGDLVKRLLDPNPKRRPRSALEVAEAFAAIAGRSPQPAAPAPVADTTQIVEPPTTAPRATSPQQGRRRWFAAIGAGGAVVALSVAGVMVLTAGDGAGEGLGSSPTTTVATTTVENRASTTQTGEAAAEVIEDTPFPLPDNAVVNEINDEETIAVVAASLQEVVDFYYQRIHTDWTPEPPSTNTADEARFEMISSTRTAIVVLAPTAQDVGAGIVEINVTYQNR